MHRFGGSCRQQADEMPHRALAWERPAGAARCGSQGGLGLALATGFTHFSFFRPLRWLPGQYREGRRRLEWQCCQVATLARTYFPLVTKLADMTFTRCPERSWAAGPGRSVPAPLCAGKQPRAPGFEERNHGHRVAEARAATISVSTYGRGTTGGRQLSNRTGTAIRRTPAADCCSGSRRRSGCCRPAGGGRSGSAPRSRRSDFSPRSCRP
jgi:hypothetical protein